MSKIVYNVPEHLEEIFKGKKQSEIDSIITSSLSSNNMALVQNMCLDILFKVNELSTGTVVQQKETAKETSKKIEEKVEKAVTSSAREETVKEDIKTSSKKGKSGKKRFMAGVVR